ncbi:unnamed protein product, partial [Didymodactylos carnosus]
EMKLYDDSLLISTERLGRGIQGINSETYSKSLHDHIEHFANMENKRHNINILYENLDRDTRQRYSRTHQQELDRKSNDLQVCV